MTPPDEGQGGMDAGVPAPAQVNARVAALVERGLERYGAGDLAGALGEWEHALALDPAAAQAREYIDYVRDNFATLDEQFRAASAIKDSVRASGVPVPEEPEEVSGAYDLVELDEGQVTPVGADGPAGVARARSRERQNGELGVATLPRNGSLQDLDEGWGMDDLAAPLPPPPPTAAPPLAPAPSAVSTLDEDLAAVAAGLQIRDTGAPIPTLEEAPGAPDDDEPPGPVVEMDADEPDADEAARAAAAAIDVPEIEPETGDADGTKVPTVVGGDAPPPLPERPELSPEAIAALGGRVPTLTINPRLPRAASEGTNAGTVPGYVAAVATLPEDAQTPSPGELPAPPHVATPSELVLELGSFDTGVGDERGSSDGLGSHAAEIPYYPTGELADDRSDSRPGEILAEPGESSYDGGATAAPTNSKLPLGVGEPISAALLGLSGDDTGEATRPAGAKRAMELLPDDLGGEPELSVEGELAGPPDVSLDLGEADFDDQPRTSERLAAAADAGPRSPFAGDMTAGLAEGTDDRLRMGQPAGAPAVIVDEQLLRGIDDSGDEITNARARLPSIGDLGVAGPGAGVLPRAASEMPTNARAALPEGLPADTDEDRIRRRVSELLSLAREAAERGDHLHAVEAAEAASAEDPEGKIGPVILHRHRDLLYRIYEGHIGEMTQVPLLAVPLHQIAAERLDHRTGFLLSRIDGLLSFEDILDVAGMPRLDAYRILSNLLRRGFIEVR